MSDYLNNASLPGKRALEIGYGTDGPQEIAADGNYPSDAGIEIRGFAKKRCKVRGTWDSATAKWQYSDDGTNWSDLDGASLTEDGSRVENDDQPRYWRLNISGGGGSMALEYAARFEVA